MANFKIAHDLTSKTEGGYTNHPNDAGNYTGGKVGVGALIGTNYGISAPVLQAYLQRVPSVADMKNLSKEIAESIYYKNYWMPVRGNELVNQTIANMIYDKAVNMGVSASLRLAQRAAQIEETGKMDDFTLNKINLNG